MEQASEPNLAVALSSGLERVSESGLADNRPHASLVPRAVRVGHVPMSASVFTMSPLDTVIDVDGESRHLWTVEIQSRRASAQVSRSISSDRSRESDTEFKDTLNLDLRKMLGTFLGALMFRFNIAPTVEHRSSATVSRGGTRSASWCSLWSFPDRPGPARV